MRVIGKVLFWLIVLLVVAFAGFAVWVRVAPVDAAAEHVDPLTVTRAANPNNVLLGPAGTDGADREAAVWMATPEALMAAFDAAALAAERTERIAGSVEDLHATYLQRSALMAYPDMVSVKALPAGEGATLAIYSRSRFGRSDLGVNDKRVSAWLDAIALPRVE
ncbi:MAG: DUF1499 domain-containing protein [Pseudomonadota bacterium]